MSEGTQVRFVDPRQGFWRHGVLVKEGWKWAVVEQYGTGKRFRVPKEDVQPEVDDATA